MLDLIIKVKKRVLEYFLLIVRYPIFFRVISFSDIVFESGEDHDEQVIFLVRDQSQ